jgi:hypothetical protein
VTAYAAAVLDEGDEGLVAVPFGRVCCEDGTQLSVEVEQYRNADGTVGAARVALVPVVGGQQFDAKTLSPAGTRYLLRLLQASLDAAEGCFQ